MATREEIYTAIRNADKAGDSAAVRKLGDYLKTMPPEAPKPLDASSTHEMAVKAAEPSTASKIASNIVDYAPPIATVDAAGNLLSGAVATPIAGLAGIGAGVTNALGITKTPAADVVRNVQSALTYQPRTKLGQATVGAISYPFQKLAEGADWAGAKTAQATGSPALGAAVNTGIQAIPALIAPEARGAFASAGRAVTGGGKIAASTAADTAALAAATEKAKAYVTGAAGLDWNSLSDSLKAKLTTVAQGAGQLEQLDPAALARQARLEALNLPATRGQVTRNLAQLTREENLTKSDVGAPISAVNAAQDEILHDHIDALRGNTGASPASQTRQGLGTSVQGSLRTKAGVLKDDYNKAYSDAREQGATAEPADISPLQDWLKNPTNSRNASYLKQAIQDYLPKDANGEVIPGGERHISINDLEEIRKEAAANAGTPGPTGHFAAQATKVIDSILDQSGGDLYQSARAKFRAYKQEFEGQGSVAKLVDEKGYTNDRAVALEDTLNHVLNAPAENIAGIKSSLTEGGTTATRTQGIQSWKDIQAGVLDYLKEKAAGKRAIIGDTSTPAGQKAFANNKELLQFNSTFRDAFSELDKDGKIDAIFDPSTAARLRQIYDAVGDVRTKPTGRIAGSDTTPRAIAMLESLGDIGSKVIGKVPVVGKLAAAGVDVLRESAAKRADAAAATTTPLNEAVAKAAGKASRADYGRQAKGAVPLVPLSSLSQQPR